MESLAARGYDATVDDLLHPERFPRLEEDLLERFHSEHADEEAPPWTAMRWMYRMINSQRPLEEKMALMWHGVFATGYAKVVNNPMLRLQVEMMRDNGLGNFRTLLQKLSRDPAMIYWLDQQMNHGVAVNENYGRELLELFSMGRGNYTEDDVRACAQAFTGWTIDQTFPRYPTGYYASTFVYRPEDHDDSEKTFLGETGRFNGDDIIDIIVRQPATARFVGSHIYRFFVSDDPDDGAIDTLAQACVDSGYEIRDVMRVLFHSDFFKEARFKKVKSPVEYVIGTVKLAGQHTDPYEFGLERLARISTMMGQELLNPPTVEGWHPGREWIDSSYLIERVNFAVARLGNLSAPGVSRMIERIADGRSSISPSELVDACLYELGAIEINNNAKRILLEELGITADVPCNSDEFGKIVAQVFQLIGASREYQFA
jgi:uncharacterized protein (DUF1800 family)